MNTQVCRFCAYTGRLRFNPCPNHAAPVNPRDCEHANARPTIAANHARNCPSLRCLDCGTFTACKCSPIVAAYDAWEAARNGGSPAATVESLSDTLAAVMVEIEAAYK